MQAFDLEFSPKLKCLNNQENLYEISAKDIMYALTHYQKKYDEGSKNFFTTFIKDFYCELIKKLASTSTINNTKTIKFKINNKDDMKEWIKNNSANRDDINQWMIFLCFSGISYLYMKIEQKDNKSIGKFIQEGSFHVFTNFYIINRKNSNLGAELIEMDFIKNLVEFCKEVNEEKMGDKIVELLKMCGVNLSQETAKQFKEALEEKIEKEKIAQEKINQEILDHKFKEEQVKKKNLNLQKNIHLGNGDDWEDSKKMVENLKSGGGDNKDKEEMFDVVIPEKPPGSNVPLNDLQEEKHKDENRKVEGMGKGKEEMDEENNDNEKGDSKLSPFGVIAKSIDSENIVNIQEAVKSYSKNDQIKIIEALYVIWKLKQIEPEKYIQGFEWCDKNKANSSLLQCFKKNYVVTSHNNNQEKKPLHMFDILEKVEGEYPKWIEMIKQLSEEELLKNRIKECEEYLAKLDDEIASKKYEKVVGNENNVMEIKDKDKKQYPDLCNKYKGVAELKAILENKDTSVLEKNLNFTYKLEIENAGQLARDIAKHRASAAVFFKGVVLIILSIATLSAAAHIYKCTTGTYNFFSSNGSRLVEKMVAAGPRLAPKGVRVKG